VRLAILSDIHYAGAAEQARGRDFELRGVTNPVLRGLLRAYRDYVWQRDPLHQTHLLERFLDQVGPVDFVVANGDFSCNTAALGVSDDAACESVRQCLAKLRERFAPRLRLVYGDHELGKVSLVGKRGGMRLASWHRARQELDLEPFWQETLGSHVLMGVVSSLVALPTFEADTLPAERADWQALRAEHLGLVREAFAQLQPSQRVLLFCHDPTALPFLWQEPLIQQKIAQVEQTIIGHLHSPLVLWQSRRLAGMPRIRFLGHSADRFSTALGQARFWRPFKVRLCPALGGIQLLKDGGYLTADLDRAAREPAQFQFHRLAPGAASS
jgi:hypothetical protein